MPRKPFIKILPISLSLFIFAGVSWVILETAAAEEKGDAVRAPASQPSRNPGGPRVQCKEWPKDAGFEGECQVETEATTWKVPFYREGVEKRTLKNLTKNLIVIFPADGSSHKLHEWWDSLLGPGKPIDTREWTVLSLNYPAGDNSKISMSLFLTMDEILRVDRAVVDYLYPERKSFVVGGASRGAQAAFLFSRQYPKEIRALFMIGFQGSNRDAETRHSGRSLEDLDLTESTLGPYEYWPTDRKEDYWKRTLGADVLAVQYTEEYFKEAKWLPEVNLTPAEYKGPEAFKAEMMKTWVDYFRENEHPRPLFQRMVIMNDATAGLSREDYRRLPKQTLLVGNRMDRQDILSSVEDFHQRLEAAGKKVSYRLIDDARGHNACCVSNMPQGTAEGLEKWLEDL